MQAAALVPFHTIQAQQLLGREGLAASPTHSRPARLSAPEQPGAHAGPPVSAPITPLTHAAEEPRQPFPFPGSPLPFEGALGTYKAGTMLAAQQPGSLPGAGAKAKQEQPWRPGRRDGLGQQWRGRPLAPTLSPLQLGGAPTGSRGALHYSSSLTCPLHKNKPAPLSP